MSTNIKIANDIQQTELGNIVTLLEIDASNIEGGSIHYFTPQVSGGSSIVFNGVTYTPLDAELDGFEFTSDGQLPRPTIKIGNVSKALQSAVIALNDLVGAKVTRRRTKEKYLDGKPTADSSAQFPEDIYVIERKTEHNKFYITWELSAYLDFEGKYLPARQILRDTCTHTYRYWDADSSSFVYDDASCPYTDSNYFTADNTVTASPSADKCGKHLSSCKLRFPSSSLPTRAFPGVSRQGGRFR